MYIEYPPSSQKGGQAVHLLSLKKIHYAPFHSHLQTVSISSPAIHQCTTNPALGPHCKLKLFHLCQHAYPNLILAT